MGLFVNPDNEAFQAALNARIYVDKSEFINYTNSVLESTDAFICNSRPSGSGSLLRLICSLLTTAEAAIQKKCFQT